MAEKAVICLVFVCLIGMIAAESLTLTGIEGNGICKDSADKTRFILRSIAMFKRLRNCVVIVGNLAITLEFTDPENFANVSFPNLKEITGYFVMYRVKGLSSIGQLFPNLARIRGTELLNNYALIIYDMFNLTEIGLYSLLKIDRGGVILWELPQACFVDTVNWEVIAPKSRHVIAHPERKTPCNFPCTCTSNTASNHCWNNRKCQLYVEGKDKMNCSDQCLGCLKTKADDCFLCKYYTHQLKCVPQCPDDTLILKDNMYCVNLTECKNIGGWEFNKTCVFECPMNFTMKSSKNRDKYCEPCTGCYQICGDQYIHTTASIQAAERCVHINGSLEIHIRAIPEAMEELQRLRNIEEVSDYILIYGSLTIKSLNFLSGLRRIGGRKLRNERYSFLLHDMVNLHELLPENVTKKIKVDKGAVQIYGNPKLCGSKIEYFRQRFPETSDDADIPKGSNGYAGACDEMLIDLQTRFINETTATVFFPLTNRNLEYTVLYARIPSGIYNNLIPETCSDSEWLSVDVFVNSSSQCGFVELNSLQPASTYAICVEIYNPELRILARSNIFNFTMPTGTPEPPFITELVASYYEAVVLKWLDHEDYKQRITHYQLQVILIETRMNEFHNINYCKHIFDEDPLTDYDRHARVMRPPPEYGRSCESMCGVLSTVTEGALVDEFFDVCGSLNFDCNVDDMDQTIQNSTYKNYVRTLNLIIEKRPENGFRVAGLAPYRDYAFKLRACVFNLCSRSVRGVVRTFRSKHADVPTIKSIMALETGLLTVHWEHPEVTNGPILSYSVEVLPKIGYNPHLLPQSWCILPTKTYVIIQSSPADKYKIRVCSKTLASSSTCSEWKVVVAVKLQFWWLNALIVSVLLFIASMVFGYYFRIRYRSDRQRLIEADISFLNESDPPSVLASMPFYTVPLNDNNMID